MANDRSLAMAGIYVIRNLVNGKVYVGSSIDIWKRWKRHIFDLRRNKHHSVHLQRAWNKYGSTSFGFCLAEQTGSEKKVLEQREKHWFEVLGASKRETGYNIVELPERSSGFGGIDHWHAKLTEHQVLEIRTLAKLGYAISEIGKLYGIKRCGTHQIVRRMTWASLPDIDVDVSHIKPGDFVRKRGEDHGSSKLNDDLVKTIRLRLSSGETVSDIAKDIGVSWGAIGSIRDNKTWTHVK